MTVVYYFHSCPTHQVSSIGRPGVGADWDMNRLQLLSHEIYCMGGPAMIFSNAAMRAIRPYLGSCLKAIFRHDELTGTLWHDDDVEIGRCLSRMLDVQCSNSLEVCYTVCVCIHCTYILAYVI